MKRFNRFLVPAAVLGLLAAGAQAAHVVMPDGRKIEGREIRAKSDGEIILTTDQGTRSFFPGQYVKAVADRPPEMDRATQLVAGRQYDEAIKLLEDVAVRFRFLDWDNQARAMLPRVHAAKGDYSAAISAYDRLFALSPKSREDGEIMWSYRQILLEAKQYDKLEPLLSQVIAGDTRADAARAQIMRGDVRMSQNQVEAAALDYLRTVVLFASEKASQPEAVFKAADALEKLRDARAKEWYKRVVDEYPASPQAAAARAKL